MKATEEFLEFQGLRQKMSRLGVEGLTDHELLELMLARRGIGRNGTQVANEVLRIVDGTTRASLEVLEALSGVVGVGRESAQKMVAAFEFSRRRLSARGIRITEAREAVPLILHYAHKHQEHFLTITLNGANEVIAVRCVSVGLVNSTQVHPREVFADAITDRACAIIVAHNHPSGDLRPSAADLEVTTRLINAGRLLGLVVLDHIIFTASGNFLSLRDDATIQFRPD